MEVSTKAPRSRPWLVILIVLAAAVVAGLIYWFIVRDDSPVQTQPPTQATSQNETSSTNNNNQINQPPQTYPLKVYFSKNPESNDDPSYAVAVNRICPDSGVAKCAVSELLKGPADAEKAKGYFTPLKISGDSNCDSQDFTITIANGLAKVQFCRNLELTGVLADARIQTVIEKSLKQFPTVSKVAILDKNGNCPLDMTGENRCLR